MKSDIEEVGHWFSISFTFIRRAQGCLKLTDFPGVILNSQQALEFAIKGLIVAKGIQIEKTHDQGIQLKKFSNPAEQQRLMSIIELSKDLAREYFDSRYPEDESLFLAYDAQQVDTIFSKTIQAVKFCMSEILVIKNLTKPVFLEFILNDYQGKLQREMKKFVHQYGF